MVLSFGFVTKPVLVTHDVLAIAEECFKASPVAYAGLPVSRVRVHKMLGGGTARPAVPN